MKKIVIGGQLAKQHIADIIKEIAGDKVEVQIMGDIDAAMAIKSNNADYYFGACATGAGAAVAMVIAFVGVEKCCSVAIPGKIMSKEQIKAEVENGKVAFGCMDSSIDRAVPLVLECILD